MDIDNTYDLDQSNPLDSNGFHLLKQLKKTLEANGRMRATAVDSMESPKVVIDNAAEKELIGTLLNFRPEMHFGEAPNSEHVTNQIRWKALHFATVEANNRYLAMIKLIQKKKMGIIKRRCLRLAGLKNCIDSNGLRIELAKVSWAAIELTKYNLLISFLEKHLGQGQNPQRPVSG